MRIAIYGAGSLGTILGAYLAKAGKDVELITRNKAHKGAEPGRRKGGWDSQYERASQGADAGSNGGRL